MSSTLDRLITLTQKTGDRLVVHDTREGKEVVILPLSVYEELADRPKASAGLSTDELEEQINQAISLWREKKEQEEEQERATALEQDVAAETSQLTNDEPSSLSKPIPFVLHERNKNIKEESIIEEPVFLEEPV